MRTLDRSTVLWNVPYLQNPFFTGRAKALHDLHRALNDEGAVALTQAKAVGGTGGVGKTQTAIAYAYRNREQYEAIFWVRADSVWTFIADLLAIATLLGFAESGPRAWKKSLRLVSAWFKKHENWLLIVDNADKPDLIADWLPLASPGHVLLASRSQTVATVGVSRSVELGELAQEEALRFLYKRTGRLDTDTLERKSATQVVHTLGGFPLALELAGAFLATNQMGFRDYLSGLKESDDKDASPGSANWREAALSAWRKNMQRVEEESPLSVELLRASAYVDPDRIPIDLLTHSAEEFGPVLSPVLNQAGQDLRVIDTLLAPLERYALAQQDEESRSYRIHPFTQDLVKVGLGQESRRLWAARTFHALHRFISLEEGAPEHVSHEMMAQAHAATKLVQDRKVESKDGAHMLRQLGLLLHEQGGFAEAESLLKGAVSVYESVLGPHHPEVATSLHDLACRYAAEKKFAEADQCFKRSLEVREAMLGKNHADVAVYLEDIGRRYDAMGRDSQADHFFGRSLVIREQALGPHHLDLAISLHELACRYAGQSRQEEADRLFTRSLAIREEALGKNHLEVGGYLLEHACRLGDQGRFQEAEPLMRRALAIAKKELPPDHRDLSNYLNGLARLYHSVRKYSLAELFYKQTLAIRETTDHPQLAATLNNLGGLYHEQAKYGKAEPLLQRALAVAKKALPSDHPDVAICSNNLAATLYARGKFPDAESLFEQALSIRERHVPADHPDLITTLENYAQLLRKLKRNREAGTLEDRATTIRGGSVTPGLPT